MVEIHREYQEQYWRQHYHESSRKCKQPEPEDDFKYLYGRSCSCILKFDGASKGNPGPTGAGAVLRSRNRNKRCVLRENLGIATNNVAEYQALILGMKHALKEGYKEVHARGDSLLVCNQVNGIYKVYNQDLAELWQEVRELKAKFLSFHISHVPRELNTAADRQANLALSLREGKVEVECKKYVRVQTRVRRNRMAAAYRYV